MRRFTPAETFAVACLSLFFLISGFVLLFAYGLIPWVQGLQSPFESRYWIGVFCLGLAFVTFEIAEKFKYQPTEEEKRRLNLK